jgi:hypothetical protein
VYLILPVTLDFPFFIAPSVFSNVYFRLVYLLLPVILDFLFLIAPSVFSNVYFRPVFCLPVVAGYSGKINVRENRRGNKKWKIQSNWQDQVHKTLDEYKR